MTFEYLGIAGLNHAIKSWQKVLCPRCSSQRKKSYEPCLSVNIELGAYKCHNCDFRGSISNDKRFVFTPITRSNHAPEKKYHTEILSRRGISRETISRSEVSTYRKWFSRIDGETDCIGFEYWVGEDLVNTKFVAYAKDGEKMQLQVKNGDQSLFGLNLSLKSSSAKKKLVIVEGEFDQLSFVEAGYPSCVSLPNGAVQANDKQVGNKLQAIHNCMRHIEHIEQFYLACDMDSHGRRTNEELAKILGREKCLIVSFPEGCKDANDTLLKHGKEALLDCLRSARPLPIDGVVDTGGAFDEYMYIKEYGFPSGARTGWLEFDELLKFFPGQITVVTGVPGSGKSSFLDNLILRLSLTSGYKTVIFSPENPSVPVQAIRFAEQLIGKNFFTEQTKEESVDAFRYIERNFYFIESSSEGFGLDSILKACSWYVKHVGVNALVIDPYNVVQHHRKPGEGESEYVGRFLLQLKYYAREKNIHIFLVAHPTKMGTDSENKILKPNLYSISGSANFYNMTDHGIIVERGELGTDIYVDKVKFRWNGRVGMASLMFNPSSQRFYSPLDDKNSVNYLEEFDAELPF